MNRLFRRGNKPKTGESPYIHWWQRFLGRGAAALAVAVIEALGILGPLEQIAYRSLFNLRGSQPWDERVVIIAIDEAAIKKLGKFSRSREQYARLLDILTPARPSLVVLDMLMNQETPEDPQLAASMKRRVPVVLAMAWNKQGGALLPTSELRQQAIAEGHVLSSEDSDGITRKIEPQIRGVPALGIASVRVYPPAKGIVKLLEKTQPLWVNWPGSTRTISKYSFTEVIRGQVPASAFQDKIVLVGSTIAGFNPLQTPFDINPPASGIHLHAAVISNLLQQNYLRSLSIEQWLTLKKLLLYLLTGSVVSFAIAPCSLKRQLILGLGLCGGWGLLGFILFKANYLLPVASPIALFFLTTIAIALQEWWRIKAQLEDNQDLLRQQRYYDPVTELPNRTFFIECLKKTACWDDDCLFVVFFVYLDQSKVIGTHQGHAVGDRLLVEIAAKIQTCLSSTDTIARYGDNTFTILLENLQGKDKAFDIAERIGKVLSPPLQLEREEVFCTLSIGIAFSDQTKLSANYPNTPPLNLDNQPENIVYLAEFAASQVKAPGEIDYAVFDPNLHEREVERLRLNIDLWQAIERTNNKLGQAANEKNKIESSFLLHYQPIISLETGKISGFEALVRWQHPQRGMVSPIDFIPLAEETGLITLLGQWILREACYQLRTWHQMFPLKSPAIVVVNLSTIQLQQLELLPQIKSILQETGLDSRYLKLEITESGIMENAEATTELLEQLKASGIQLSIDDFGTGYSSLWRLQHLPVDTLKIDQSFIRQTTNNDETWEIIQIIITLAHKLRMTVVAEGIEKEEQLEKIKHLQCDYGQGYLFSKPLDASDATALLAEDPKWLS